MLFDYHRAGLISLLLFFDILASTQKRRRGGDVNAMGGAQKRARIEQVHECASSATTLGRIVSLEKEDELLPMVSQGEGDDDDELPPVVFPEKEESLPAPQEEEDGPVLTQPSSAWWSHYREGLSWITLDGVDVAVTLLEWESFIQELPFLECVLPSMQAGEPYFVPVFIQVILFPLWEHGRGHFSEHELAILDLTREQLFPAISGYLELLSIAALLEQPQPVDAAGNVFWGIRASQLVAFVRTFFGVDFLGGDQTVEQLRLRLLEHLQKIPALLMIGRQWGFNVTKIAVNIKRLGCLDPSWLQAKSLQHDAAVDALLDAVIKGIRLPDLPKTVPIIAWTMRPEFTCSINLATGEQVLQMMLHYQCAPGRVGSDALPSPSLRSILQALKSTRKTEKKRGTTDKDGKKRRRPTAAEEKEKSTIVAEVDSGPSEPRPLAAPAVQDFQSYLLNFESPSLSQSPSQTGWASSPMGSIVFQEQPQSLLPENHAAPLQDCQNLLYRRPSLECASLLQCPAQAEATYSSTAMDSNDQPQSVSSPLPVSSEAPKSISNEQLGEPPRPSSISPQRAASLLWNRYRDGLNRITLDGQDVAVTLYESESFILDLPFLEFVLPSMQGGEFGFVPLFIQKVLLPYWKRGRGVYRAMENRILSLSREHFFPAVQGYLDLLFLSAVLEEPLDTANIAVEGRKASRLIDLICSFFGVSPPSDFLWGSLNLEGLRARVAGILRRIPSMLMIGHQWGFDATKIAANIQRLGCLEQAFLESKNCNVESFHDTITFLDAITNGMPLPDLPNLVTVDWIAWTMSPEFTCSFDTDTGEQVMRPRPRYDFVEKSVWPVVSPYSRKLTVSLRGILRILEIREMNRKPDYVPFLSFDRQETERPKKAPASSSGKKALTTRARAPRKKRRTTVNREKECQRRSPVETRGEPPRVTGEMSQEAEPQFEVYASLSSGSHTHDYILPGSDVAAPEGPDHPARFSPPRSDDQPIDSTDSNGIAQCQEDEFSRMLREDPLSPLDDMYGFNFDLHPDELDPDLFADYFDP